MNEFDIKAADWDNDPMHRERSVTVADEIIKLVPLSKKMRALEYGAGTGVTSLILKDYLKEITLMDNSSEMVRVMNEKIEKSQIKNLKTLNFNLETDEYKEGKFDLIFSQMVLHHVNDIEKIAGTFHRLLNPGCFLAIADLSKEDGSFHGDGFTGHKGFDISSLTNILMKNRFSDIRHKTCFVIERKISETETKQFEVFILVARRD